MPVGSVSRLCPTLCDPMDCSPPGSSVHGISQTRTHVLLQGIFPTEGLNLCLLHWQTDSLSLSHVHEALPSLCRTSHRTPSHSAPLYVQSKELFTVLSSLCVSSPLERSPPSAIFLLIVSPCSSPVELPLKSPGWSDHMCLPASTVPWTYPWAGSWAPTLYTWAASAHHRGACPSVCILFIFISQHLWWDHRSAPSRHCSCHFSCLIFNKNSFALAANSAQLSKDEKMRQDEIRTSQQLLMPVWCITDHTSI